jgi:hypothetical protein
LTPRTQIHYTAGNPRVTSNRVQQANGCFVEIRKPANSYHRAIYPMHRVTYTAQEAILKIKKEPVPAWF